MGFAVRIFSRFDVLGGALLAGALISVVIAETARPLRPRQRTRRSRWPENAGYGVLAAILVRGAIEPAIDGCARWAAKRNPKRNRNSGLLMRWLPLPAVGPVRAAVGFLALDYTMYLWHRALHEVSVLWRFHSVHHADADLDASTALRFHVGELAASLPFRCVQASMLGVSSSVALSYDVAMQAAAIFHHSNTRLPDSVERWLGFVFVTPRMHGIHHSVTTCERDSNWSVLFSFWDRLHGTHRSREGQPTIGLVSENTPR